MDQNLIPRLYAFFQQAEKLKLVMRHSWIGNEDRQESTAEHSWMLCLVALSIFPYLETNIDEERVLRLLIIHDLVEAIAGDVPAFEESTRRESKEETERAALGEISRDLDAPLRKEFSELWEEFEAKQTPESLIARAIDKYEAILTHALADIDTWDEGDYNIAFGRHDELFAFDPFLAKLKRHIDEITYAKLKETDRLNRLDPDYLHHYFPA